MRAWPSIVPHGADQDTYLVLDDFGDRLGRAWRETDEEGTDRKTLIGDWRATAATGPHRRLQYSRRLVP